MAMLSHVGSLFPTLPSNCKFLVEKFYGRKYKRQIKRLYSSFVLGAVCLFALAARNLNIYALCFMKQWGRSWGGVFEWIDAGAACANGTTPNKTDNKQNPPCTLVCIFYLFQQVYYLYVISNEDL